MAVYSTSHEIDSTNREVAEGVYRFGTQRINWYVLEADDRLTVVDAGLPAHWPQLNDWLDTNNYEVDDIAAVLLTHADVDHVGFARTLADQGVPVYCHPDDRSLPVPGKPRVIFAPGHTPGSCALYAADRDVLLCGDVLATRNIFTGREGDPQLLGAADEDHDEAKASLARLEGLGSVTLLPGHENPWRGDIDEALALAR